MKFYIAVAIAFVAAFAGISAAMRGAPTTGFGKMAALPASAAVGQSPAPQQNGKARTPENHPRLSAHDTPLNQIRYNVLLAAYGYSVMPCDERSKAKFIHAATDYAKAFLSRTNSSLLSCSREQLEIAGAVFDTKDDRKIQSAITTAFSRGGITVADFPVGREMAMLGFIGTESANNYCSGGQRRAAR